MYIFLQYNFIILFYSTMIMTYMNEWWLDREPILYYIVVNIQSGLKLWGHPQIIFVAIVIHILLNIYKAIHYNIPSMES